MWEVTVLPLCHHGPVDWIMTVGSLNEKLELLKHSDRKRLHPILLHQFHLLPSSAKAMWIGMCIICMEEINHQEALQQERRRKEVFH